MFGRPALLRQNPQFAISSDMLVESRHFFADVDPAALGHKALAFNLSDLAACGAKPLAFTLALALPAVDAQWLQGFSRGMWALADAHDCDLVGGDTTQGPLNICITVFGEVPHGQALLRSGAMAGDDIYVSGTPGDARLALQALRGTVTLPMALGLTLRGIASAAIDLSDGLAGDLSHLPAASGVGARVSAEFATDLIAGCAASAWAKGLISYEDLLEYVFAGGDDYELFFTATPAAREAVLAAANESQILVTRIGVVEPEKGLRITRASGELLPRNFLSFDHFAPWHGG